MNRLHPESSALRWIAVFSAAVYLFLAVPASCCVEFCNDSETEHEHAVLQTGCCHHPVLIPLNPIPLPEADAAPTHSLRDEKSPGENFPQRIEHPPRQSA